MKIGTQSNTNLILLLERWKKIKQKNRQKKSTPPPTFGIAHMNRKSAGSQASSHIMKLKSRRPHVCKSMAKEI